MWVALALLSALFAGITSILVKVGIKNVHSHLAMALRTIVILIFAWMMTFVDGSISQLAAIDQRSFLFLILSGLATGASWICYMRALQLGDVNKVVPVDKSSTVLTMLLSFLLLGESITWLKGIAMVLIGAGTYLMIERKASVVCDTGEVRKGRGWLFWAILSALAASLTAILGKIGIDHVPSNLGTAVRTVVVLFMAWGIVFGQGLQKDICKIDRRSMVFIGLSGVSTGLSWLFYYRALKDGLASVVAPIDKLSILISIGFGMLFLHEKLTARSAIGLALIVGGTVCLLL